MYVHGLLEDVSRGGVGRGGVEREGYEEDDDKLSGEHSHGLRLEEEVHLHGLL